MNIKSIAGKLGTGLFVIAFLYIGLKGCVMTTWSSPKTPRIYSIVGNDNRVMTMVFMPKHKTMIWYLDPSEKHLEGVLTEMKGTYGTHYFWQFWHVDGPDIVFGYRIYPSDTEPVHMEITVLERYMEGRGDPTFPNKGDRNYEIFLFGKGLVRFQGMWLKEEESSSAKIEALLSKFSPSASIN